ncbi:hypothetical protein ETD83_37075 [Actinomadura soli]|uniref:Transposase n=1 Tax=Actinomadura soli TaxID=2508997 RepID=A0A5C4J3H7_9ACTN|nr:hypothetical protein [Actinomadura soli]TMQ90069.1 hypothetical protein ETD83_37075 [Actinomadura soli]
MRERGRQTAAPTAGAAVDIDAFNASRTPVPRTAEELLILSADGKGIVMRPEALRPATAKAAARHSRTFRTRLAAGEKPARKSMATLGVVYDALPAPRRPHDVIAVPGGRRGARPPRPGQHARRKWLCGSVLAEPDEVIAQLFDHAEARDPTHARTWVVLVDGARHQLDLIRAEATHRKVKINVVHSHPNASRSCASRYGSQSGVGSSSSFNSLRSLDSSGSAPVSSRSALRLRSAQALSMAMTAGSSTWWRCGTASSAAKSKVSVWEKTVLHGGVSPKANGLRRLTAYSERYNQPEAARGHCPVGVPHRRPGWLVGVGAGHASWTPPGEVASFVRGHARRDRRRPRTSRNGP